MVNLTYGTVFDMEQVSEEERGCVTRNDRCTDRETMQCCSGLRCKCYYRRSAMPWRCHCEDA
nr:venom protein [Lampona murina]